MYRIGIIGCADIAFNRFIPATQKNQEVKIVAIASETRKDRLHEFSERFGIETEDSYKELFTRKDINIIYIPQPPSRHFELAKYALENGKNVFLEKPLTTTFEEAKELVELARKKKLVIFENYMFVYHLQMKEIKRMIDSGEIGKIRLIETRFGFPFRGKADFRYNKDLGGGALLDAGGYTLKLASYFMGDGTKVLSSKLVKDKDCDVDIFGNIALVNEEGIVCNASFGMDCQYQCSLQVWGSEGMISTERIYTAPTDLMTSVILKKQQEEKEIDLGKDDHFYNSIRKFCDAVNSDINRECLYQEIMLQAGLMNEVRALADKETM